MIFKNRIMATIPLLQPHVKFKNANLITIPIIKIDDKLKKWRMTIVCVFSSSSNIISGHWLHQNHNIIKFQCASQGLGFRNPGMLSTFNQPSTQQQCLDCHLVMV
jgi:hypothetical protein